MVEYRKLGHSDIESVLLGLSKTGRVITYAGLIMAAGFGGLLFAHEALLSQLSFLVVVRISTPSFNRNPHLQLARVDPGTASAIFKPVPPSSNRPP